MSNSVSRKPAATSDTFYLPFVDGAKAETNGRPVRQLLRQALRPSVVEMIASRPVWPEMNGISVDYDCKAHEEKDGHDYHDN
ncbi:hypothetical protein N7533_001575 [Penicillium manginii]|uniref:uncharacterized protein n=1 Tax=Penicillium manginii TaxID=203109 RepID=UPI002547197E|nr:uncharacterized protein N7533_001575 [Penicillium manginii]KAJ5762894.1 hypothetical protein N7533_001575 [Penicillium manginii]